MSYATVAAVAVVAIAAAVASYTTYTSIENQKQQFKAERKAHLVDKENALNRAKAQEDNARLRAQRFLSTQKAQMGKTGALAGEGSFLDAELEAASMGEYEALLSGYDSRQQAHRSQYAADLATWQRRRLSSQQMTSTLIAGVGAGASAYGSTMGASRGAPTGAEHNLKTSTLDKYSIGSNKWDSDW